MLKPEQIDKLSFNRIVDLYNQLNIDICADIIDRVSAMGNITQTTEDELRVILELNGQDIFKEILEKTSALDDETRQELYKVYADMVQTDMQDYRTLYKYRDKEFKLSKKQMKILNKGIKENNKIIRNFTKSIAFSGKELFINVVDEAYLKAISGAMSYDKAIYQGYKDIASTGLTLKDRAGRNTNLDVAIRRCVATGIQQTANDINEETGKILGCDGYEVTAHLGARPTHAEAQGKQYAETKEDAKKFGVGWWYDTIEGTPIAELWEEINCRHTVFPIILGISEPAYTKKELYDLANTKTTLYGKEVSIYEANQEMRRIERNIRHYKREVKILNKADVEYSEEMAKLRKWQKEYTKVSKETGIEKDHFRIKI